MAGHNKWSKVKHIKARVDARKDTFDVFINFDVPNDTLTQLEA